MISVLKILGWFFAALATAMLMPLAFAVAYNEVEAIQAFIATIVINIFLAGSLLFALGGHQTTGQRQEGLLLVCLIWVTIPVTAAFPILFTGTSPSLSGAIFESVSGFTTTGATIIYDYASVPRSILVWRGLLQWLGGLTTLLSLAVILYPLIGLDLLDRQLRQISSSTRGTELQIFDTLKALTPIYGGLTLLCFVLLIFSGIPSFDAFCLSLSTISTGGFMPRGGSIKLYGSPSAEFILAVFMFLGAVSVVWIGAIFQFQWKLAKKIREPYWIALTIFLLGILLAVLLILDSPQNGLRGIYHSITTGMATSASFISTTGFSISNEAEEIIPYIIVLIACVIGGGRFSTAGGIKFYRIFAMLIHSAKELNLLIYPHGIRGRSKETGSPETTMAQILTANFAVVIVTIGSIALFLSTSKIPLEGALMASISAISNIGPAYELIAVPALDNAPPYSDISSLGQLALCVAMILGRIEVLALLSLINFAYWRFR